MGAQKAQIAVRRRWRPADCVHLLALAPLALLLALFVAALASMAIMSFRPYEGGLIRSGLTLNNYARFLTDGYYMGILGWTLLLGALVTVTTLIVGYPAAYVIAQAGRHKGLLIALAVSPILVSSVIRTYAWLTLLANNGFINNTLRGLGLTHEPLQLMYNRMGVGIGLTHVLLPYMILSLVAALQNVDPALLEAARSLGASGRRAFLSVTLPLSVPGIISGSLLVFTLSIASFITPAILGSPKTKMLSELVYAYFMEGGNWPYGSAIAFILLTTSLGATMFYNRLLQAYMRRGD